MNTCMDGCMQGQLVGRMQGWMDGGMYRWMDGCIGGWMGGGMYGWMDGGMEGCMAVQMDGCMYSWMDGWIGAQINIDKKTFHVSSSSVLFQQFLGIKTVCVCFPGSPISTPSHSPLSRTPTSTPVHMKTSSSVNNPYLIADKPGQVISMTTPTTGIPFTYTVLF